jgi:hypothetical protein
VGIVAGEPAAAAVLPAALPVEPAVPDAGAPLTPADALPPVPLFPLVDGVPAEPKELEPAAPDAVLRLRSWLHRLSQRSSPVVQRLPYWIQRYRALVAGARDEQHRRDGGSRLELQPVLFWHP